jgi:2-polyprenyl-3-methyl-5-hydroxy-6-metoxy-1,4-benzoquinol methylase
MQEQDIAETQERYRKRWLQYGYHARTLGWNKGGQGVRFQAALEQIRAEECASILDVGCGFGDLLTYLRERGWAGTYTGIDIVSELIAEARRRHDSDAGADFLNAELTAVAPQPADMVVSLGVFNHRLTEDSRSFVERMIEAMWRSCRQVMVCDFLSSSADADARQERLFYADAADVLKIAQRYSRRVVVHHGYMPFEFNVKVWRDDAYTAETPVFRPYLECS